MNCCGLTAQTPALPWIVLIGPAQAMRECLWRKYSCALLCWLGTLAHICWQERATRLCLDARGFIAHGGEENMHLGKHNESWPHRNLGLSGSKQTIKVKYWDTKLDWLSWQIALSNSAWWVCFWLCLQRVICNYAQVLEWKTRC